MEESKSEDKVLKLPLLPDNAEPPKCIDLIQPTLDELKSPKTRKSEGKKAKEVNYISRCVFMFLAVVFFMLLVISLVSFSAFYHNYRVIQTDTIYGTTNDYGSCILFISYNFSRSGPKVHLGSNWSCAFSATGQILIAIYALVSIAVVINKIYRGLIL